MAFRTNKTPVLQNKSASGAIVSFDTILTKPLEECTSLITGYQEGSGTPSPSNVRPLHAWSSAGLTACGTNLWDEEWEIGRIEDHTGEVITGNKLISKNYISCTPNTTYYKRGTTAYGWCLFFYYDANKNFISQDLRWTDDSAFTTPNDCYYMKFMTYNNQTTYNNDISINYPSTDTSYHAYTGDAYTFTFGQSIYQGSIDWKRGVVVGTHSIVDLGTLNWNKYRDDVFYTTISGLKSPTTTSERNQGMICEKYVPSTTYSVAEIQDKSYLRFNQTENFWVKDSVYTDAATFKTAMNGVMLAYELATPIEIPLTPQIISTLAGQTNNIFCDTGDTSVVFKDLDIAKRGSFREVFKLP